MLALTELLGRPAIAADGMRLGAVRDLAVRMDDPYPIVTRLVVRMDRRRTRTVAWAAVDALDRAGARIATESALDDAPVPEGEMLLARDVLDVQIVDVAGRRLV